MDDSNHVRRAEARSHVQAAAWRAHLTGAPEDSDAFNQWLSAAPENRAAWEHMQAPWDILTEHASAPELIAVRRAALNRVHAAGRQRLRRANGGWRWISPALAASLTLVVAGALTAWLMTRPDTYRTHTSERRIVDLPDGSRLTLDAQSEVHIKYSGESRMLRLVRGQARFDVAPDAARPFVVRVQDHRVLATGTAFNVDRLNARTFVTLIEGRVVVTHTRLDQRIELSPDEQVIFSSGAAPVVRTVAGDQATAWQNGQLVFDNEPLSSVIERVNRYSSRRIEVADRETGLLRVTGVFNLGDIRSFVATATGYLPVKAETLPGGSIRLRHR